MFNYLTVHTYNALDTLTPKLKFSHTELRYSFMNWQEDAGSFFCNGTAQLFSSDSSAVLATEQSCNYLIIQIFIYKNPWETEKKCADISENAQRGLINLIKLRQK